MQEHYITQYKLLFHYVTWNRTNTTKMRTICHVSGVLPLTLATQSGVMWDTFCVQALSLQQP